MSIQMKCCIRTCLLCLRYDRVSIKNGVDCSIDLVRKIKLVKFNVRKLRYGDPIYITTSLQPFTTKL